LDAQHHTLRSREPFKEMNMPELSFSARKLADAATAKSQCAIVPLFQRNDLSGAAKQLDAAADGLISAQLKLGDFDPEPGSTRFLPGAGKADRILLLGVGKRGKLERAAAHKIIDGLCNALNNCKAVDALLHIEELVTDAVDGAWLCERLACRVVASSYRYKETVSKPKKPMTVTRVTVNCGDAIATRSANAALERGLAMGHGVNVARDLANMPGNICTPSYLADRARQLARGQDKLTTRILDEKKMRQLGMGSLLSVAAGSEEPPRLVVMEYKGGKSKQKPYVLVGKGITFDSGGISLKPGAKMDEMKYDMGGAASVMGAMTALLELQLPINVIGIIAAAENMPSGRATKPGDVVRSMSGKTIEVLNTDAEGRLVLCDALTYAERFKPQAVIDIATLTGACVVALGSHASGLYANDEQLAGQLLEAGTDTNDRAWRMPLWDDYQKQLDSNFADVANIGGPGGGSITAACFLSRFAENYHWAHLDIAGSAWDSSPKGATGRPVPLLTRYLLDRAGR
jgi:leucyl aminopeptidase